MDTYGSGTDRDMEDVAERLGDLLKLDVDAVRAYDEVIEKIESQEHRSRLSTFRDDHQRHVTELTSAIQGMGQKPPEASPDFKGLLIEGMTKLRSSMGDEQALKAMHQNEEITNKAYEKAVNEQQWPTEVRAIVERGLADERAHIQWIDQQLSVASGASQGRTSGSSGYNT